jgi:hypothetical protein
VGSAEYAIEVIETSGKETTGNRAERFAGKSSASFQNAPASIAEVTIGSTSISRKSRRPTRKIIAKGRDNPESRIG